MKALVYACFDPKVWPSVADIFNERFGRGNYFLYTDPGAAKNLVSPPLGFNVPRAVITKMKAAYALHSFKTIIIINHSKCGAYKLAGKEFNDQNREAEFHKRELEKAARILKKEFPKLTVETHYFLKEEDRMKW